MDTEVKAAPDSLLKPINVPQKLLLGPGPANASPAILAASALPILGHMHPETFKIMEEIKEGIRYAFQTENSMTLAVSGTGHAAMEAVAVNLIEPGDVVMVGTSGLWGNRFSDLVERQGGKVQQIHSQLGHPLSLTQIEDGLKRHQPVLLFLAHGESSTGLLQPLDGVGDACHRHGCLLVVDTVASLGGTPFFMDTWKVDCVYSGSQKVLSAPPGTAPISFNDRCVSKMRSRRSPVTSFYLDVYNHLANYWRCDNSGAARYHHTAPVTALYGLREGLAALAREGLEASWRRHEACAQLLQAGLEKLGLQMFIDKKKHRLPTVNTIRVPAGVQWQKIPRYAMEKYRLEISGGLGPSAGKVWRIGLMGYNATEDNVRLVLRVMEEALKEAGTSAKL